MPNETSVASLPVLWIRALADGQDEIVELRHVERLAVENFVLEEDDRVGVADSGLQETLCVGCRIGLHHLQSRDVTVPGRIILAVLRRDARRCAVGAAEDDRRAIWPPDM